MIIGGGSKRKAIVAEMRIERAMVFGFLRGRVRYYKQAPPSDAESNNHREFNAFSTAFRNAFEEIVAPETPSISIRCCSMIFFTSFA